MSRGAGLALGACGILVLVAAAALLYGPYLFLPSYLERNVASSLQEEFALESTPRVALERGSAAEVRTGRFSGGRVEMSNVELDGILAEEVVVDLAAVDLDLLGSIVAGRIESQNPVSGTLRATISEEEILRVVRAGAEVPVLDLGLASDGVVVDSETTVFGLTVPVSLRGELVLRGEDLVFEPRRVTALGSELPPELAEGALSGTDLSYPMEGLPAGADVTGLEVGDGRLVVTAEMRRIPLG